MTKATDRAFSQSIVLSIGDGFPESITIAVEPFCDEGATGVEIQLVLESGDSVVVSPDGQEWDFELAHLSITEAKHLRDVLNFAIQDAEQWSARDDRFSLDFVRDW